MSASLPSSVRLKGWVTTAKGLACTTAIVSPEGSPVQVTLTELDDVSPVRRKGWDSSPVPDWPLAEKVHDGSVEAPADVTVDVTPMPTNMDPAPIPITAPSPTSFRQKRRPPALPAPELIFDNIVPPVCWMCPPAGELAPSARDCRSLNPAVNTRGCASVGVSLWAWSENGHEHGSLCDIGKGAIGGRCGCHNMEADSGLQPRVGPARPPSRREQGRAKVTSKANDVHARGTDDVADANGPTPEREKDPAAVARGRLGGQARAKNTPPQVRSNDAREAVNARWAAERSRRKGRQRGANPQ